MLRLWEKRPESAAEETHIPDPYGKIPFFCSLCEYVADSLPCLSNHLASENHKSNNAKIEGPFTNKSFVYIAGDHAIYLQEGKQYCMLPTETSDKI